jgi:opacity protein-like surface antigen
MLSLFILNSGNLFSTDSNESNNAKLIHIELGYGVDELSTGIGFKYSFADVPYSIGATLGLSGFAKSIPRYGYKLPTTKTTEIESFATFVVSGDINLFYEWKDFSFYGSLGFYSQADTVLSKDMSTNTTFYYYENTKSESGLAFGAGVQYYVLESIVLGLGYQNKKGVYLQIGYSGY